MKKLITIILFTFFCPINSALAVAITPTLEFDTLVLSTSPGTDFSIDFGASGDSVSLQDLTLTLYFDVNGIDVNEAYGYSYLADTNTATPAWIGSANPSSYTSLLSYEININNIFINQNGIGLLNAYVTGNGAIIERYTLTGNATITTAPVPLPPSILMLILGLITLLIPKTLTNHSTWTVKN